MIWRKHSKKCIRTDKAMICKYPSDDGFKYDTYTIVKNKTGETITPTFKNYPDAFMAKHSLGDNDALKRKEEKEKG